MRWAACLFAPPACLRSPLEMGSERDLSLRGILRRAEARALRALVDGLELLKERHLETGRRIHPRIERAPRCDARRGGERRASLDETLGRVRGVVDLEGDPDARARSPIGLDSVDEPYLRRVGELERRESRVENRDAGIPLALEGGALGQPEHVTVEGECGIEVIGFDDQPKLANGGGGCGVFGHAAYAKSSHQCEVQVRIGELSARSGASVRSLRYYEECGLIAAERTASGQRQFREETVERVRLVRQLLAAGLGTTAIADVLPCLADPAAQTSALTHRLVEERDRLDAEIADRVAMRTALDDVIRWAPPTD